MRLNLAAWAVVLLLWGHVCWAQQPAATADSTRSNATISLSGIMRVAENVTLKRTGCSFISWRKIGLKFERMGSHADLFE